MANITTQTIRVDLSTDKVIPSAFTHQNDTARTLEFSMYNKGVPYTMTGNTVKFAYKSPIVDGAYTVITGSGMASGTVSGNKVTVTLPSAYTAISGVGMLTMIITPTSGTVRPVNIRLVVKKSADGDDTISGASDFPTTLQQIADEWYDENIANWLNENIESVYDAEAFGTAIDSWLDDHPEATTTVEDGSITYAKLNESLASGLVEDNGTYKYDYNELANIPEPKPSIPLLEKPTMVLKKSFARLTDSDSYSYGQQGAVVTDNYIVLGMNSLGTNADKRNLIYILDKTTYEPVTLSVTNPIQLEFTSSTTPTASHANSIAWDKERGEVYVFTMNDNIAIVFDDTTFAEKRREVMPTGGQIGYDNINKQWCFITYASNNSEYSIQIWDDAKQNLIKRVSGSRIGTTQGVLFHDGLIYLPTSVDSSVTTYGGMQNIKVLDTESNLMRSWWFASGVELEDIGLINESTMMIACNSGNNIALYEMQYRSADSISELDAFDAFDLCGRVDTIGGKLVNQHTGADGWSYVLDPATKFIIALGRFNVTPTTWTQSDNMLYYSEAFSISTPFTMSNYKYSVLCGGRKLASNPSHGTSNLGFRLQSTGETTSTVDANIVLVGFIA